MKPNRRAVAYLLLFLAYFIWGIAGPIIKYTLSYFPPSVFITYRFGISLLLSFILLLLIPNRFTAKTKQLPTILLYGFLMSTAAIGLVFIGFDKTTAMTGSLFGALTPIATTIAGAILLHEHVTKKERLGISIALLGTLLVIAEPILMGFTDGLPTSFEGNMYHIAALIITVLTAVMAKIILRNTIEPITLTHISFAVGFATMLPIVLANHSPAEIISYIRDAPLGGHLGVLFMAVFSGTIAYTFWHIGEKSIEIGEASLFTYFYPLFAAPLSIFWLHETVSPLFLLGALIITAGVILAEYRKSLSRTPVKQRQPRRKR